MKKHDENKITMYMTVRRMLKQHSTLIAEVAAMEEAAELLDGYLVQISTQRSIQERLDKGVTLNKEVVQQNLAQRAANAANALVAYATVNGLVELAESMRLTEKGLLRERDTTMLEHCKRVRDKANEYSLEIEPYGITSVELADIVLLIDEFETVVTAPRNASAERSSALREIQRLMQAVDKHLEDVLDKLAPLFVTRDIKFMPEYEKARMIIDLGVRHEGTGDGTVDPTDDGSDAAGSDGSKDGTGVDDHTGK